MAPSMVAFTSNSGRVEGQRAPFRTKRLCCSILRRPGRRSGTMSGRHERDETEQLRQEVEALRAELRETRALCAALERRLLGVVAVLRLTGEAAKAV
jgi:hypothetical protein